MVDWTEKYRPSSLSEIRGNDSARDDLAEWAQTWDDHRESVVVHGSPGIGKTSAAHALASDMGWDVIELNASDQRTADVIERVAGEAAKTGTLVGGTGGRKLIILDEADNIHGTADRGGAAAITRLVKEADQPIVLIANEYYDMSRGLRNATREIEFRDVSKRSILPVIRDICRREGIEYEDEALDALAEKNAGDLRSAINDLQAIAEETSVLTEADIVSGRRDTTEGIFDFLDAVLKEKGAEAALKMSYDVDETPDDLIHWVEDNMPKDYEGTELAAAYRFLATGDRWLGRVRATQEYSYWRYVTDNVVAGVASAREGTKGGWTRYGPPSYWRKLGRSRGARDTRDHVAREIAQRSGVSMSTARREVMPFLAVMTHHCTNRELTVAMATAYDMDESHVAFVTGSGEDTNKVQSIVEDARERQASAAVEHSEEAFEGASATGDLESPSSGTAGDGTNETAEQETSESAGETADDTRDGDADSDDDPESDGAAAEDDDSQSGLDDFF